MDWQGLGRLRTAARSVSLSFARHARPKIPLMMLITGGGYFTIIICLP